MILSTLSRPEDDLLIVLIIKLFPRLIAFQLVTVDGDIDRNVGHVNLGNDAALRVISPHIDDVLRSSIKFCSR